MLSFHTGTPFTPVHRGPGWWAQVKTGLTEDILNELTEFSNKMSKYRKKRVISASLITAEEIEAFQLVAANPVHKTTQVQGSKPRGVL
jgi:hypothetical protein